MPYAKRVVNRLDLVPHVPPLGFENYTHHSEEVWYRQGTDRDAAFELSGQDTPTSGSNSASALLLNVPDHVVYYRNFLVGFGGLGCARDLRGLAQTAAAVGSRLLPAARHLLNP